MRKGPRIGKHKLFVSCTGTVRIRYSVEFLREKRGEQPFGFREEMPFRFDITDKSRKQRPMNAVQTIVETDKAVATGFRYFDWTSDETNKEITAVIRKK